LRSFQQSISAKVVQNSLQETTAQSGSDRKDLDYSSIEDVLQEVISERLLSGVIVGIINRDQRELFTIGSGLTSDALIELGSVTKVFTGLLFAAMMERGLVHMDDPVHQYLPSSLAAKPGDRPIRVRDLVLHRAGFPSQASNTGRMKRHIQDPYFGYTDDDLMEELSRYDLQRPETQQYSYSNLGYALLGHVLEKAGGAPFSVLMKRWVLEPMGLRHSCIEVTPDQERGMPRGYTQAGRKAMRWYPSSFAPCGGICSTASDCMQFLETFLQPAGPLKQAIEAMLSPNLPPEEGRVLTWKQRAGEEWLWHNGVTGGFSAYMGFHPERELGLVLLTNRYAITLITELGQRVQSILMGEKPAPMSGEYEMKKAYAAQALIEFVESPVWLRVGAAGLATGIFSWLLR
jgi:serine-type D-Ala-D-Ala carboxypeptidase/endopeptidase